MIDNLNECFENAYEYSLEEVSYKKLDAAGKSTRMMKCEENVTANLAAGQGVKITARRTISFDPEGLYEMSVAFCAFMKFKPGMEEKYDWANMNIAEEFHKNGGFVVDQLVSRISLLVANITGSYGRVPVILPPNFVRPDAQEAPVLAEPMKGKFEPVE